MCFLTFLVFIIVFCFGNLSTVRHDILTLNDITWIIKELRSFLFIHRITELKCWKAPTSFENCAAHYQLVFTRWLEIVGETFLNNQTHLPLWQLLWVVNMFMHCPQLDYPSLIGHIWVNLLSQLTKGIDFNHMAINPPLMLITPKGD